MSEPRYLGRDQAREIAFIDVDLGDGLQVKARRLSTLELFAAGIIAPAVVAPPAAEVDGEAVLRARLRKQAVDTERKLTTEPDTMRRLIGLALYRPRLWTGPEDECPEDAVTFEAFAPHLDRFLMEYMPRMGYGESRRKAVDFRDPEGAGDGSPSAGPLDGAEPARTA